MLLDFPGSCVSADAVEIVRACVCVLHSRYACYIVTRIAFGKSELVLSTCIRARSFIFTRVHTLYIYNSLSLSKAQRVPLLAHIRTMCRIFARIRSYIYTIRNVFFCPLVPFSTNCTSRKDIFECYKARVKPFDYELSTFFLAAFCWSSYYKKIKASFKSH